MHWYHLHTGTYFKNNNDAVDGLWEKNTSVDQMVCEKQTEVEIYQPDSICDE